MTRTIQVEVRETDIRKRTNASDPPEGANRIGNAVVTDQYGKVVLVHKQIGNSGASLLENLRPWLARFQGWDTQGESRLSGIGSANRTFGYTEPSKMRKRYACASSLFNLGWPAATSVLELIAMDAWNELLLEAPYEAGNHLSKVEDIKHCWRFGGAPWTSGVMNRTAAMPYHRDSGNVADSWSAMVVLRRGFEGGLLHVPELDIYLECKDLSVTLFNGQKHLHGVTPLHRPPSMQRSEWQGSASYRFSIVFYAKRGFLDAGTPEEELLRAQSRASEVVE